MMRRQRRERKPGLICAPLLRLCSTLAAGARPHSRHGLMIPDRPPTSPVYSNGKGACPLRGRAAYPTSRPRAAVAEVRPEASGRGVRLAEGPVPSSRERTGRGQKRDLLRVPPAGTLASEVIAGKGSG